MGGTLEEWLVLHVVHIHATSGEELRVFLAQHAVAENASSHVAKLVQTDARWSRPSARRADLNRAVVYG
jgi:hypothetical protein